MSWRDQPASAKRWAVAAPMPREAPVISAVEDNNKKGTWTNRPNDQFFKEYYALADDSWVSDVAAASISGCSK